GEDVGQRLRVDLVDGDSVHLQVDVGEDGGGDAGVEGGDGFVQALAGADVGAAAVVVLDEGVEEDGVDVVADAEGEEADVGGGGLVDVVEDGGDVGLAFGGETVGEEEDVGGAIGFGHGHRFEEGAVDVGAAGGPEAADPVDGVGGGGGGLEVAGVDAD